MSRPPIVATSRNISAWSMQAVSQVGWRLAVASRAKMRRPRGCVVCDLGFPILARKVSRSGVVGAVLLCVVGRWSVMECFHGEFWDGSGPRVKFHLSGLSGLLPMFLPPL